MIHMNFVQIAEFDWLPWQHKIFQNLFLRSRKWDEAELCIHVHYISLYVNYIFYCCCPCALVAMAT